MANNVFDYDWQSVYPSIVKPTQLQMYEAILKGENEMNIKETLNQIYGKSAATNAPIKDNITQEDTFGYLAKV